MSDCVFCKIANKEMEADIIHENDELVVFKDIHPKAPVHLLIIPKRHISSLNEVGEWGIDLMGKIVYQGRQTAMAQGIADSGYKLIFNCGPDGGQVIGHIHLHLLGGKKLE